MTYVTKIEFLNDRLDQQISVENSLDTIRGKALPDDKLNFNQLRELLADFFRGGRLRS
jgi:hypothetical protein